MTGIWNMRVSIANLIMGFDLNAIIDIYLCYFLLYEQICQVSELRGPPRGFGEQERTAIYFRGTNKGHILRGTGEQRQYWGKGNIRKQFFFGGEQGNKLLYFRGTREQVPHWEGLN